MLVLMSCEVHLMSANMMKTSGRPESGAAAQPRVEPGSLSELPRFGAAVCVCSLTKITGVD